MNTIHKMRISWPDEYDKDKCIETLVDNIIARFPDAEVLSAPVDVGEENINGITTRWIEQSFKSSFFDRVADSVIDSVLIELVDMRDSLFDESEENPFTREQSEFISLLMDTVIEHISHKFTGENFEH